MGTSSTPIFEFVPSQLHSVIFKATGALEIGHQGVQAGSGLELGAGEAIGFDHKDFRMSVDDSVVRISAVAAVATTIQVFGFMR